MSGAAIAIGGRPEPVFAEWRPKRNVLLPAEGAIPGAQILHPFFNDRAGTPDLDLAQELQLSQRVMAFANNAVLVGYLPRPCTYGHSAVGNSSSLFLFLRWRPIKIESEAVPEDGRQQSAFWRSAILFFDQFFGDRARLERWPRRLPVWVHCLIDSRRPKRRNVSASLGDRHLQLFAARPNHGPSIR